MPMEWIKVLKNRKTIGMLVLLLAFQLFFFLYTMESTKEDIGDFENYSSTSDFQMQYEKYIRETISRADSMGNLSIFNQDGSYAKSNLAKTKADYQKMLEVKPVLFEDTFYITFLEYSFTHIIALIAGIVVVFSLTEEKKQGIRNIIFSASNGRGILAVKKAGALLLWTAIVVFCFYGMTLLASALRSGQNIAESIFYPMQSIRLLTGIPWKLNILEYLLAFLGYRIVVLYVVLLFFWLLLFAMENQLLAIALSMTAGVISYLTDMLISANHSLNLLHYLNPWYQMADNDFITVYRNLNLWENAVGKETLIIMEWILLSALLLLLGILVGKYRYPCKSLGRLADFTGRIRKILNRAAVFFRRMVEKLPLRFLELYKILYCQKGILILFAMVMVFFFSTEYRNTTPLGSQKLFSAFVEKYEGTITPEAEQELQELQTLLAQVKAEYQQALEDYELGKITEEQIFDYDLKYASYEKERVFEQNLSEYTIYLKQLKTQSGIDGWYLNLYSYNHLLKYRNRISDIVLLLGIVLLCSNIFAYDKTHGMRYVLRSCADGRNRLFKNQIFMAAVVSFVLSLIAVGFEFSNTLYSYSLSGFDAPAQSIPALSFVPFSCSVGAFLIFVYLTKITILVFCGITTSALSVFVNPKICTAVAVVLCTPDLLSLAGIRLFENFSVLKVVSTGAYMLECDSIWNVLTVLFALAVVTLMGCTAAYRNWCCRDKRWIWN